MVATASKTHVCGEGDCFERQSADERIALAESICKSRGSRLTPARQCTQVNVGESAATGRL